MTIKLSPLLQSKFNIFLYLTFGWGLAKFYIFLIGKLYFFLNKKEKQIINDAFVDVIGRVNRDVDTRDMTNKIFQGIFSHYYEKMFIAFEDYKRKNKFINHNISSNDLLVIRKCLIKGKGVIFITGHYGAIEYLPALLGLNGFDISMIAKFKTVQLKEKIISQSRKYNTRFIDADNTGNVLKSAIRELKENRVLITQCDEIDEWRISEKRRISFLGQVTGLDRTIDVIQRRTGAEVVFGVIHRFNLNKYKLIVYSQKDMLKMLEGISMSSIGEAVLKVLEQFIYYYPEQWYQWKKYPEVVSKSASISKVGKPKSLPILRPSFGKVL